MVDWYCILLFSYCIFFLVVGYMYRINFGIGYSIKDFLEVYIFLGGRLGCGYKGFYDIINNLIYF